MILLLLLHRTFAFDNCEDKDNINDFNLFFGDEDALVDDIVDDDNDDVNILPQT